MFYVYMERNPLSYSFTVHRYAHDFTKFDHSFNDSFILLSYCVSLFFFFFISIPRDCVLISYITLNANQAFPSHIASVPVGYH
ncbi:hypothetical protein M441DRAFT_258731 [Trichoderma asperellum CBS 433.97]|uniref:Uncharacterized protein n=1 Tax=Trichoderma asperellum (strain ATCC 204424 / CBS 433.97 / NBRC 101777) TaxID=1042311 RepID=A0A2T3YZ33_TRIA4|nr:hypothetical protein M441DRAFT_258731 [Trichoderma asperellum CBS 433.97]PTB37826.1 hypothetical protein M441DRAFT_258731 [Trichoderma asperellum CBS 433.97]